MAPQFSRLERLPVTQEVTGSNPVGVAIYAVLVFNGQHLCLPSRKYGFESRVLLQYSHRRPHLTALVRSTLVGVLFPVGCQKRLKIKDNCGVGSTLVSDKKLPYIMRGRAVVAHRPHESKVAGSSPAPAPISLYRAIVQWTRTRGFHPLNWSSILHSVTSRTN